MWSKYFYLLTPVKLTQVIQVVNVYYFIMVRMLFYLFHFQWFLILKRDVKLLLKWWDIIYDDWIKELESCCRSAQVFVDNLRCLRYKGSSAKILIKNSVVFIWTFQNV